MDSKAFSLHPSQKRADPELLSDPEPFSHLLSKDDSLVSPPLTQSSSPASSSFSTSAPILRTQHEYCVTNGKGKGDDRPWLTLRVSSRSPKSKLLPLFVGKDPISGIVELEFAKPETVREVKVTVRMVSDMHHSRLTVTYGKVA
jgi:hypothetical protein